MKSKLKIILSMFILIFTYACSDDITNDLNNISEEVTVQSKSLELDIIEVDHSEIFDFDEELLEAIQYENIVLDDERISYVNVEENTLYIPFDVDGSIEFENRSFVGICIKIEVARLNNPDPTGCHSCACGVGFKCGFVSFDCGQTHRQSMTQSGDLHVDSDTGYVILRFLYEIDWDYFVNGNE